MPQLPEYVYLGGAPHDMLMFHDADLTIPAHGLRGCILSFLLAEAELELTSFHRDTNTVPPDWTFSSFLVLAASEKSSSLTLYRPNISCACSVRAAQSTEESVRMTPARLEPM